MSLYTPEQRTGLGTVTPPQSLGEIACGILSDLDILTLDAPTRKASEFPTTNDYNKYLENLRFSRKQVRLGLFALPQGVEFTARSLLMDGALHWDLSARRPTDEQGINGYFNNENPDFMFALGLELHRVKYASPLEFITIYQDQLDGSEPMMTFRDTYGHTPEDTPLEPYTETAQDHLRVVKAVAQELHTEAGALVDLRLDAILSK